MGGQRAADPNEKKISPFLNAVIGKILTFIYNSYT